MAQGPKVRYNKPMETKNTKSEFTANTWMASAKPAAKVGRNFAKPVPRLARKENKKSFLQKMFKA
jgi:hypothetical protein